LFAALPVISNADPVIWTSGDYEIRNNNEWHHIIELQTYNDVTVKMYEGTSVNQFSMYDNSELTTYGGAITYLNLYDNATASFFGLGPLNELYIDPASVAQVKLYATFSKFEPYGLDGEGTLYVRWLSNNYSFQFGLVGEGAYDHVQFVPEPASAVIFALGSLLICSRRRRNRTG